MSPLTLKGLSPEDLVTGGGSPPRAPVKVWALVSAEADVDESEALVAVAVNAGEVIFAFDAVTVVMFAAVVEF